MSNLEKIEDNSIDIPKFQKPNDILPRVERNSTRRSSIFSRTNKGKIEPVQNKNTVIIVVVIILTLFSIILTSVLIGLYEHNQLIRIDAFSIIVICITGVFFVISLLSLRSIEVVDNYNIYRIIVAFCLVIQIVFIILSVLVYLKIL
jgi:hypothetical protein